jgi:hypothetical protein
MGSATHLEKIEHQIMQLPVYEQTHLIERITAQLRCVRAKSRIALNLSDLYGMGKGIWREDDAQEYVNRVREERI